MIQSNYNVSSALNSPKSESTSSKHTHSLMRFLTGALALTGQVVAASTTSMRGAANSSSLAVISQTAVVQTPSKLSF